MLDLQLHRNEVFSIATLIYARLRRVTGRVIDAMYLAENIHYAKHVIGLAEQTEDPELLHLVSRLKTTLDLSSFSELQAEEQVEKELISVEPSEEDIYRAQVSHHYIGALR